MINFGNSFKRPAVLALAACNCLLLAFAMSPANAAKPPATPLSCSISPDSGTTATGTPITFTASTQSGKGQKSYSWDFSDGFGSPNSSTSNPVNVTYNDTGTFNVLLDVSDSKGSAASCSTTVTVGSVNQAPVANDDTAATNQNTPVTINVVANDTDADGTVDPTTVVVSQPANGGTFSNNDGTVDYTPDPGFTGADSFTYTVKDDQGLISNVATVSITVTAVGGNQPPVAQADNFNTDEDTVLGGNVLADNGNGPDSDPDGDNISVTAFDAVSANGASVSISATGNLNYDPTIATVLQALNNGESLNDTFSYTISDNGSPPLTASTTVTVNVSGITDVAISINSTSQNGSGVTAVAEQPAPGAAGSSDGNHVILAINDLGMHCGDLDTRVSSILPPFNVIHAQVLQRSSTGTPSILSEMDGIDVFYSAASNANDPALSGFGTTGEALLNSEVNGTVFKTNFWDIAPGATESTALAAYRPFYPPGILDAFDPTQFLGLPMPDVERLYLGDGVLAADEQVMPGHGGPYVSNDGQLARQFVGDMPFFTSFPFGYVANGVNWFEAAGVPLATFDDAGLENTYPLMRVQARSNGGGSVLATVDTVVPISGEANCQGCHGALIDGGNGSAIADLGNVADSMDDPDVGDVPLEVSKEYSSDINILRLHDQKHGTSLETATPVVCQTCHYTPALDLAQVGPRGLENDTPVNSGDPSNGRDQVKNKSMSNVMHSHHATVTDTNGAPLFPEMPPPVSGNSLRDPVAADDILQQTCYQCHPGRRTACLRGAMSSGGMLCQDCHGNMAQVGDDFSRNVDPDNPGAFELAGDFYTNPATPRVPWANEPGCGSCHTGDALDNMHGDPDTLGSPNDGIRLMQAWLDGDSKATPIVPTNKRFAEDVVESGDAAGNPKLYRVSVGGQVLSDLGSAGVQKSGHGGLFCEACHGATHAIWPNANPNANDNVTANQLQGHTGTITECATCHEPNDAGLPLGLEGPHGMHPITANGDDRWNFDHKSYGGSSNNNCRTCHGADLKGTVLSRAAADRTVTCKNTAGSLCNDRNNLVATIPKGTEVDCGLCHKQKR